MLTKSQDGLDSQLSDLRTKEISTAKLHELSERTSQTSQGDFENAMKLELLEDDELGESRSVKFRTFSTPLYVLLLIFLGMGEFAITRAAFAYLFNENETGILEHDAHLTLLNKNNNFINWYKNHLLIKLFLESKKCNWTWNGWFATNAYTDSNRFDGDYYPFKDLGADDIHSGPEHNRIYANNLHSYLKENKILPEVG
jgi:hypothetical protein